MCLFHVGCCFCFLLLLYTVVEATLLAATVGNGYAAVMAMAHNNAAP